jgi:hypothetical protein
VDAYGRTELGWTIRVLEFFGAIPNLRNPDNLKAAIKKACLRWSINPATRA